MNNKYHLRIYLAGVSPENQTMIVNIKDELKILVGENNFQLEVIDVLERPNVATEEFILATPTIARISPEPAKRVVVNFNNASDSINGLKLIIDKEVTSD